MSNRPSPGPFHAVIDINRDDLGREKSSISYRHVGCRPDCGACAKRQTGKGKKARQTPLTKKIIHFHVLLVPGHTTPFRSMRHEEALCSQLISPGGRPPVGSRAASWTGP